MERTCALLHGNRTKRLILIFYIPAFVYIDTKLQVADDNNMLIPCMYINININTFIANSVVVLFLLIFSLIYLHHIFLSA